MSNDNAIRAAISIGDPNGIGPEVVIKTFMDPRMLDTVTPVIYGSSRLFNQYKKAFKLEEFNFHSIKDASEARPKKINVVSTWKDDYDLQFGTRSEVAGKFAFASLEAATGDLAAGKCDVLVTAPIDKKIIQSDAFDFPGHTEYLARMSNVDEALMFMISEGLRVGIVTGHMALNDVPAAITKDRILRKLDQMMASLEKDFAIRKPKIAVLGLNPHAGEKGMMGKEEQDVITPAINSYKEKGNMVFGPYPADGFFGSSAYQQFDAVLAMYHDQGLAPFKALSFGYGVNFTAGLPIVRTSPDHGTAFEIAGQGLANEASFRSAVFLAQEIFMNRKMYKEITANPLKAQKQEREHGH
jgi:4-hydroxythreonine-4-phosphate dehydrogenase